MTTTKIEKYHVEGKVAVKIVPLGSNAGGLSGASEKSPPVKVKAEGKVDCKKRKSSGGGGGSRRKKSSGGSGGRKRKSSSSSEKSSNRSGRKKRSTRTEDRGVGTPTSSPAGGETIEKGSKIAIVGVGAVGMACAYSILIRGVCNELVMVDCMSDKVKGEMMDLQHGSLFAKPCVINASSDYAVIANASIVVVTAGARQKVGETRLELVNRNVDIFKGIITNIVKYAPNSLILIVSNPVDVMTYVTWKLSGFDRSRVIGSGTNLDTARFRFLLSEKLKISPKNCHGWIIGEHGDASVALWSCSNVAGIPLRAMKRGQQLDCEQIHQQVIKSAYEVIKLKGYTNWAIGLSVSDICHNILRNSMAVLPLSVSAKGLHLIKEDVYLSLPCIIGSAGIVDVIEQKLDNSELDKLHNSANTLFDLQEKLNL